MTKKALADTISPFQYCLVIVKQALPYPITYITRHGVADVAGGSQLENLMYRRVQVQLRNKPVIGFVIEQFTEPTAEIRDLQRRNIVFKEIQALIDEKPLLSDTNKNFAKWLIRYYFAEPFEVYSLFFTFSAKTIAMQQAWALKEKQEKEIQKDTGPRSLPLPIALNDEQEKAVASVEKQSKHFSMFLLHGVTGSGKSYVYVKLALQAKQRRQVSLILVPEISLVFQMKALFLKYFAEHEIALLHSMVAGKQRYLTQKKIQEGKIAVLIGTRSALFASHLDALGIIIVDEEHESAYKNSSAPRYHVRHAAQHLAKLHAIPLVLASATPSFESYYWAKRDIIKKLPLTKTFSKVQAPKIAILQRKPSSRLNEKSSLNEKENYKALSRHTQRALLATLEAGKQALVFLNKRGFSSLVSCEVCGFHPCCPSCDLSLTYHKQRGIMLCHYCGFNQKYTGECFECGRQELSFKRMGTERTLEKLESLFPQYQVARFDSDALKTSNKIDKLLQAFAKKEVQMLVGTQMMAKGHDFENVKLMVILSPENMLALPDFRSKERVFAALVQSAGRVGRRDESGEVLIETALLNDRVLALAATGQHELFYSEQLKERKNLFYPPFSKMINFVFRGKNKTESFKAARLFQERLKKSFHHVTKTEADKARKDGGNQRHASLPLKPAPATKAQILGPTECLLFRLKDYYRYHVLVKTNAIGSTWLSIAKLLRESPGGIAGYSKTAVYMEIDVDPVDLF